MKIDAPAKINVFLKITGYKEGYHTLQSRFMQVTDLYDTIVFVPSRTDGFLIVGCEEVPLHSNTVYKAYRALVEHTGSQELVRFFREHTVRIDKRIPSQAGLGGGSSDAAAFMRLANDVCNLGLTVETLAHIGGTIGADVPFFIYGYPSANVSGFGEIVEPFDEAPLPLEIFTPDVGCDTATVYNTFKTHLLDNIVLCSFQGWEKYKSEDLLALIADPIMLNDLYAAARIAYPELARIAPEGWFFSGSGSSFFRRKQ